MIEALTAYATSSVLSYFGGSIAAFILAWVLKKIPNDSIKAFFGGVMYRAGVFVTLGLSKWSVTAGFWNKTIEPWFIDAFENIIGEGVKQFILGLRSDN